MTASLLKDHTRAGLFHLPPTRRLTVIGAIAAAQLTPLSFDLAHCRSAGDALTAIGQALHFPDWYGANFDALHDCLTDPDWQAGHGLVLMVDGLAPLRNAAPEAFSTLLEVFRSAADNRSAAGQPLWILLGEPAAGIADLPAA